MSSAVVRRLRSSRDSVRCADIVSRNSRVTPSGQRAASEQLSGVRQESGQEAVDNRQWTTRFLGQRFEEGGFARALPGHGSVPSTRSAQRQPTEPLIDGSKRSLPRQLSIVNYPLS